MDNQESKFNFSNEEQSAGTAEQRKEAIRQDAKGLFTSLKIFFY